MPVEKAQKYFRGDEGYNCTQAILKAFEDIDVRAYDDYGHGMAQSGKCGALIGAQMLCPDSAVEIEEKFVAAAGDAGCRKIRAMRKFSCRECVKLAAELVIEYKGSEV